MKIKYSFMPLSEYTSIIEQDANIRNWLKRIGIELPENTQASRWPTPKEIRTILDTIENSNVTYIVESGHWQAFLKKARGADTNYKYFDLNIYGYNGDEDTPQPFLLDIE